MAIFCIHLHGQKAAVNFLCDSVFMDQYHILYTTKLTKKWVRLQSVKQPIFTVSFIVIHEVISLPIYQPKHA